MRLGHGDDGAQYAQAVRANFSSNVRRDDELLEELRGHLFTEVSRAAAYPEVYGESLAAAVAEQEGVQVEKPWIGETPRLIAREEIGRVAWINHAVCSVTVILIVVFKWAA